MIENRQDALARLVFALLVLAVFGHIWFASAPLPFGGPNVVFAVAAAVLSIVLWSWQTIPRAAGVGQAIVAGLLERFRPAAPALLVALCMWGWALAVDLRSGVFDLARLGQLATGIGVLFALLCVLCARRAKVLISAIVIATSISALFGIGVVVIGEPFLGAWLRIARVAEEDLDTIFLGGRIAGLASHPSALGYQLAVAIVFGFAALVLGAPVRRARRRRLLDVVLLLLVTPMLAALLVNASRGASMGVAVGVGLCVVGVVTGRFPRRGVPRLLVVGLLVTVILTAVFNRWRNVGDLVDALHPVRQGTGDIIDLTSGGEALVSNDPQLIGHRFEGYKPGAEYEVRLREIYRMGISWRGSTIATADADGAVVVTWRRDPGRGVVRYDVRVRETAGDFARWRPFAPGLRSRGATLAVNGLAVRDATLVADDDAALWSELADLAPGAQYDLQLRAVLPAEQGPPSQARGRADGDGRLVFTWRRALLPQVVYQYRLRHATGEPWGTWRHCTPLLPPLPVWRDLREGSETLDRGTVPPDRERVGYTIAGLRPWRWYKVQVAETLADGVDRAPRHGEVVVDARPAGYVVFTWPAPRVPEGVAGYRFRVRDVTQRWLPWRDFTPSLSSRTPVPSTLSAGWSVVEDDGLIRHTLVGLPAGIKQSAQLRARDARGFGGESVAIDGLTGDDGSFVLAWRELPRARITGYQFRLWWEASGQWRPWHDLAPRFDSGGPRFAGGTTHADLAKRALSRQHTLAVAHNAQGVAGALRVQPRLLDASDFSARSRLWQLAAAWRYAFDHPFGTGVYRPLPSHVEEGVSEAMLEEVLREPPHNQFLHVLALYGFPGLCLLLLFYAFLTRAAWRAGKLAWRERDAQLRFLVVAVVAAWAAYSVNSFWVPTGPFLQEWDHYFVIGLLLSLEGILAKERQ